MFGEILFSALRMAESLPAAPAAARGVAPAGPTPEGLEALSFLVGGVWVTASETSAGRLVRTEACEWALDRRFILTDVAAECDGKSLGTARGFFGYDPAAQCLLSGALSSTGSLTYGRETASPDAFTWVFAMHAVSAGSEQAMEITMQQTGANTMTVSSTCVVDGKPVTSVSDYRRAPKGAAAS